jgi:hypothetical protein
MKEVFDLLYKEYGQYEKFWNILFEDLFDPNEFHLSTFPLMSKTEEGFLFNIKQAYLEWQNEQTAEAEAAQPPAPQATNEMIIAKYGDTLWQGDRRPFIRYTRFQEQGIGTSTIVVGEKGQIIPEKDAIFCNFGVIYDANKKKGAIIHTSNQVSFDFAQKSVQEALYQMNIDRDDTEYLTNNVTISIYNPGIEHMSDAIAEQLVAVADAMGIRHVTTESEAIWKLSEVRLLTDEGLFVAVDPQAKTILHVANILEQNQTNPLDERKKQFLAVNVKASEGTMNFIDYEFDDDEKIIVILRQSEYDALSDELKATFDRFKDVIDLRLINDDEFMAQLAQYSDDERDRSIVITKEEPRQEFTRGFYWLIFNQYDAAHYIGFVSILNAVINFVAEASQMIQVLEPDGNILRINTPYLVEIINEVSPTMLEEIAQALKTIEIEKQVKVAA